MLPGKDSGSKLVDELTARPAYDRSNRMITILQH